MQHCFRVAPGLRATRKQSGYGRIADDLSATKVKRKLWYSSILERFANGRAFRLLHKLLPEDGCVAPRAIRIESIARDDSHSGPAQAHIQLLGETTGRRI